MTKRIFRSILAVSLAVLLASLLLIVGVLHGYFQDSVLADLTIRTAYIAHGIENEGIGYLEEDLPGGCRITLVDTDGTVLYDNREDPAEMENHADNAGTGPCCPTLRHAVGKDDLLCPAPF